MSTLSDGSKPLCAAKVMKIMQRPGPEDDLVYIEPQTGRKLQHRGFRVDALPIAVAGKASASSAAAQEPVKHIVWKPNRLSWSRSAIAEASVLKVAAYYFTPDESGSGDLIDELAERYAPEAHSNAQNVHQRIKFTRAVQTYCLPPFEAYQECRGKYSETRAASLAAGADEASIKPMHIVCGREKAEFDLCIDRNFKP